MIRIDYLQDFLKAYASLVDCKINDLFEFARPHYVDAVKALDSAYESGQISFDTYKGYFTSVSNSFSECQLRASLYPDDIDGYVAGYSVLS